ncbi:MAG: hypothetical protein CMM99_01330 [Rickettsiales bacterium]|nr:hypothetical protein [Rickettsiales bacterium]
MRAQKFSISESLFLFIINNFKKAILIFILPQIILFFYERTVENETCLGSARIIISQAINNLAIVDEVFINNLEIKNFKNVSLHGYNLVFRGNTKKDCEKTYSDVLKRAAYVNEMIEEFYFSQLNDQERSLFSNPLLFNSIGDKKILFGTITPLDLEVFKNKEKTKRKIYLFILSIVLLLVFYLSINFKKFKNYF